MQVCVVRSAMVRGAPEETLPLSSVIVAKLKFKFFVCEIYISINWQILSESLVELWLMRA